MRAHIRDTEIFFDVDGSALVPDGARMRERPTAFLLHGGPGGDHSNFKITGAPLAQRMQLIYMDHRGQGRSARGDSAKYTLDENVEDLEALRRYLGLGPIVSLGGSYGGMVAMTHAARYPDSVSHLILIVTAAHSGLIERARQIVVERGTAEQVAECEKLFSGGLDTVEKMQHYYDVMGPLYACKFDAKRAAESRARTIHSPEALNRAWAPGGGFMRNLDMRPELSSITTPTLILAGRHDWICAPEFSEEMHRLIPSSDLRIFEDSAHSVPGDEPEAFRDAVLGFVVYNTGRPSK